MDTCVPKYCRDFQHQSLSPGLQFGLYFKFWNSDFNKRIERSYGSIILGQQQQELVNRLQERQKTIAMLSSEKSTKMFAAKSTSPFLTGLGLEHPSENGFAFLNPYGLPYLSGSGVKGVLRRAAEELIRQDHFSGSNNFSLVDIWYLFGFENIECSWYEGFDLSEKDLKKYVNDVCPESKNVKLNLVSSDEKIVINDEVHFRGTLQFWDVFPNCNLLVPNCNLLEYDIMTPHYPDYFQNKDQGTPHDSSDPTPIQFLTIPANTDFRLYVSVDKSRLKKFAPHLSNNDNWVEVIEQIFEHAFEWLGFGAKTSVGYGVMERDSSEEEDFHFRSEQEDLILDIQNKAKSQNEMSKLSPLEQEFEKIFSKPKNRGMPKSTVIFKYLEIDHWVGGKKIEVAKELKKFLVEEKKWREKSYKKNSKKDKIFQRTLQVKRWIDDK